jgi:imidazolonepropionase-like amidohydrolase
MHIGDSWDGDYALDAGFFKDIAQQPARLVAAGGHVGMGSHGDIPGVGYHFEMWAHAFGGMKNHDILRAATIWSAEAIGHGKDLGSIEPGKLADLDTNPLDDIHNTLTLKWIMKGGRLYTPRTLKEFTPDEPA